MNTTAQINIDIQEIKCEIQALLKHSREMVLSGTEFESCATALKHKITDLEKSLEGYHRIGAVVEKPEPETRKTSLENRPADKTIIMGENGTQVIYHNEHKETKEKETNAEPCPF